MNEKRTSHKSKPSIAIIGAGLTGLTAAWNLRNHYNVTVYEKKDRPGGLASGFDKSDFDWSIDYHYHHVFTSDKDFLQLMYDTGLSKQVMFYRPKTSTLYNKQPYQLDSPLSLLKFPHINFVSRLRTGLGVALLKLPLPWRFLEKISAYSYIKFIMGAKSWQVIWEPLFKGKFGKQAREINLAWFWARIYARSTKLGYFNQGFLIMAKQLSKLLKSKGVKFCFENEVKKLQNINQRMHITIKHKGKTLDQSYDKILYTSTSNELDKILDNEFQNKKNLKGLAAMTLVLELKQPFLKDNIYWLNINEPNWPFIAVVEHTNMIDENHYDNKTLVYIAKYLDKKSDFWSKNTDEVLSFYKPFLEKLNKNFMQHLESYYLFKEAFAQPITLLNHSKNLPEFKINHNIYWASMQHIYPYDRGVNYAVRLGNQVSKFILEDA